MLTNDIIEKLNYIKLDLDNIPTFISNKEKIKYRPQINIDQKNYKIYKYVDVNDIEILLTPKNRLTDITERYEKATPLKEYLNEENLEKFTLFLKLLTQLSIEDIEELEKQQQLLVENLPIKIKFNKDYIWQIYYSEEEDRYFMLAPITESEYAELFYILKKQIERRSAKIFVPICNTDYNSKILTKQEIKDLENSLWFFTNNWASIYEVYDKFNNEKLVIIGKTKILENIESDYKFEFAKREEAEEFYNLVQALFILQTNFPHHYKFNIKILENGNFQFEFEGNILTSKNIISFIKEEYKKHLENIIKLKEKKINLDNQLKELQNISLKKQQLFLEKEKQISIYLECKKTFLGKVKYFFKYKKGNVESIEKKDKKEIKQNIEKKPIKYYEKPYVKNIYTIQELLEITKELEEETIIVKNLNLDIEGLKEKIRILTNKLKNAILYIQEIDKHKKSIFDFWKFTSKDELNTLVAPLEAKKTKKIEKVFNLKLDLEDIKKDLDTKARNMLSKREQDVLYLTTTPILEDINLLLNNEEIPEEHLLLLKNKFEKDKTKLTLNVLTGGNRNSEGLSKEHRETEKNIFNILNIDNTTTIEDYKENLTNILSELNNVKDKISVDMELPIYLLVKEDLKKGFVLACINPKELLTNIQEGHVKIYKITINSHTKFLPLTNIIYFNNLNKTLPLGMDKGSYLLLNISDSNLKFIGQETNNVLNFMDEKVEKIKLNILKYAV